jgi:hypothetical protein
MNESVETVREYAMGWEPKDFDEWFKGQGFGEFTRGRAIHQSCWDCGWLAGFKSRDDHITRIERHATALERELAELRAEIAGGAHDSANYPAPEVGLEGHEPGSRNSAVGERVAAPACTVDRESGTSHSGGGTKSKRSDISDGKEPASEPEYKRSHTFVERRCEDCGASVRYTERGTVVIGRDPQPPSEESSNG